MEIKKMEQLSKLFEEMDWDFLSRQKQWLEDQVHALEPSGTKACMEAEGLYHLIEELQKIRDYQPRNWLLIYTDGFSMNITRYISKKEAQNAMIDAYDRRLPSKEEWDECLKEMSYAGSDRAQLYTGSDVYLWEIEKISD